MILWFFCKISGFFGKILTTTSKRGGGLVVKAAPFQCVGLLAIFSGWYGSRQLFQWPLSTPWKYTVTPWGFLKISTLLPNSFLIGRFLQKAKGIKGTVNH